ncbi:hypothetical protein [Butyricimonas faecalis]|uniref:hypothetical protein n=1 Tax=Butyricimonas faecalis TaxID=2093856 RepID=UPI0013159EE6|nr:hypothetical protein [Butyricimonas faecalis]
MDGFCRREGVRPGRFDDVVRGGGGVSRTIRRAFYDGWTDAVGDATLRPCRPLAGTASGLQRFAGVPHEARATAWTSARLRLRLHHLFLRGGGWAFPSDSR